MKAIGIAVVVLLAVIAFQLNALRQEAPYWTDSTPGWHDLISCDTIPGDAFYTSGTCVVP